MTALEEIEHFQDVPLAIELELDRKIMKVRDILLLEPGSVVRLTRSAGENIDMIVGGALLGLGEVVIIENAVGVRITSLQSEKQEG
jgi:flagellar motor switch protein FliN/FliY